jgi:hypothetical protein
MTQASKQLDTTTAEITSTKEALIASPRPRLEVIACARNLAGPCNGGTQYIFDLRDNITSVVYQSLVGIYTKGVWTLPFLSGTNTDVGLPLPLAMTVHEQEGLKAFADQCHAIGNELDRWRRNLYALALSESDYDAEGDDLVDIPARSRLEVIACVANCAGIPDSSVRFTFDLCNKLTGHVDSGLLADRGYGEWILVCVWPIDIWPITLPDVEDLPVLSDLRGERKFVEDVPALAGLAREPFVADRAYPEWWELQKEVERELERWCRNLFAMAEVESQQDEGFDEYEEGLQDIEKEYGIDFDNGAEVDRAA